jgi:hypothetical protein
VAVRPHHPFPRRRSVIFQHLNQPENGGKNPDGSHDCNADASVCVAERAERLCVFLHPSVAVLLLVACLPGEFAPDDVNAGPKPANGDKRQKDDDPDSSIESGKRHDFDSPRIARLREFGETRGERKQKSGSVEGESCLSRLIKNPATQCAAGFFVIACVLFREN